MFSGRFFAHRRILEKFPVVSLLGGAQRGEPLLHEIILVDALDLVGRLDADADPVADHQVGEFRAVDQTTRLETRAMKS